jgi:hypothetical protein
MIRSLLGAILISTVLVISAVFLHNTVSPYGLFLAIALGPLGIRFIAKGALSKLEPITAAVAWFAILYLASTNRNGNEILVQADTNGNAFIVGSSALILLTLITILGNRRIPR